MEKSTQKEMSSEMPARKVTEIISKMNIPKSKKEAEATEHRAMLRVVEIFGCYY